MVGTSPMIKNNHNVIKKKNEIVANRLFYRNGKRVKDVQNEDDSPRSPGGADIQ